MAETLRIARGSVSEATAIMLASGGGFTVEWYDEILRDGVLVQENISVLDTSQVTMTYTYDEPHPVDDDEAEEVPPPPLGRIDDPLNEILDRVQRAMRNTVGINPVTEFINLDVTIDRDRNVTFGTPPLDGTITEVSPEQDIPAPIPIPEVAIDVPTKRRRTVVRKTEIEPIVEQSVVIDPPTTALYDNLLKNNFFKNTSFMPKDDGYCCFVFGCGGTGGRLIELLAQTIMSDSLKNKGKIFQLIIIDGDVVEQKNLSRQNFYEFEMGMNKAEALATRYGLLFGIDINFVSQNVTVENFETIIPEGIIGRNSTHIIFDCTDNMIARKNIIQCSHYIANSSGYNPYLISCGNEFDFGQVIISTVNNTSRDFTSMRNNKNYADMIYGSSLYHECLYFLSAGYLTNRPSIASNVFVPVLPEMFAIYKEFQDSQTSCAEIAAIREQSMPINSLVANLAFSIFSQISSNTKTGIKNNLITCNTESIEFSSWNFSIPDNYIKLMIRSIYGNKLDLGDIESAKAYLASMAVAYAETGYFKSVLIARFKKVGLSCESNILYAETLANTLIFLLNNYTGERSEIHKYRIPFIDVIRFHLSKINKNWIYYPLVCEIFLLWKNSLKIVENTTDRIAHLSDKTYVENGIISKYISEKFIDSLSSNSYYLNHIPFDYANISMKLFEVTKEEHDEIMVLFNDYFISIKHKVQVNYAII